jgi:hypothetical protein
VSVPRWIRPAAPVGAAVAGLAATAVIASWWLPARVTIVRSPDGGGAAFASRDDLLLVSTAVAVVLVVAYLVSAAALAWTPARHLLVPRAAYWKHPTRRRELRRRLAVHLARGTAAALWFVAALILVALVGQRGGPVGSWWIPLGVSIIYVVGMLVWLTWVLTAGFAPLPGSADGRSSTEGSVASGEARAARATAPGSTPRPIARTEPRAAPRPGEAATHPTKGPPRPYQPRPQQRGLPPRD